jgi:hypothetical protein
MPPALPGESDDAYTDRLTGADRTGRVPYDHRRNRQCSIGYHGECSERRITDPSITRNCECPCHAEPAASVPPGTYADGARSPIAWVYLCPPCGGYAPMTTEDYSGFLSGGCQGCGSSCRELHRFPSLIDSAAGCGCRGEHKRVTGDLAARLALDDSERFQAEEARAVLDGWGCKYPDTLAAPSLERLLADHGRALLDLLDKIAPKGAEDD